MIGCKGSENKFLINSIFPPLLSMISCFTSTHKSTHRNTNKNTLSEFPTHLRNKLSQMDVGKWEIILRMRENGELFS